MTFPWLGCIYTVWAVRFSITTWLCIAAALGAAAGESRPLVVTSFVPLYSWTANIAGDSTRVESLLPARAEPHEYAFTPGDARKLNSAQLIVVNGSGLEAWLPKWEGSTPGAQAKVVNISTGLAGELIGTGKHANPHFWLDPLLACEAVSNITAALQRVDPTHAVAYATNAVRYTTRLQQLDAEIRSGLAAVTNRAIVTYHDAFPYFARRYNLEVAGVVELIPDVNPTPKYLARLSRTIRDRQIRCIYVPPNSVSRLARQIAEDLRVPLVELDTLEAGEQTPDAYESRMRANLRVLRESLR
jgi:zinc transport system substrate-binding protein